MEKTNKKRNPVNIDEARLRSIARTAIRKVLNEDIDTGQYMSSQERSDFYRNKREMMDAGNGKEYQKRIRHLRNIRYDAESQFGEDAGEGISLMIEKLKNEWFKENKL